MKQKSLRVTLCLCLLGSGVFSVMAADGPDDPPAKTKDGKDAIDFDALAKMKGDAKAGEGVFRNAVGANCIQCHQIGGKGNMLGPPLDTIGEKPKEVLFESILKPSAAIQHGFETWTVRLKSGEIKTGLITEDGEEMIILRTQDSKDNEIKTADIAKRVKQEVSLMPEGLAGTMTLQELVDLVEWLSKQTVNK
jgi:putative heme-binding domain-containing protein